MGYELDKLKQLYGVATEAPVAYAGVENPGAAPTEVVKPTAPVAPTAPVVPVAPKKPVAGSGITPAVLNLMNADYQAALQQYNADMTDYKAQKALYDSQNSLYRTDLSKYNTAMAAYPKQYAQYQTDLTKWNELNDKYQLQKASYDQYVQDFQNRIGSANMYGQSQYENPLNPYQYAAQPVLAAPTYARGGSVENLAHKYQVGGAVHRFAFGGNEGVPEEDSGSMDGMQLAEAVPRRRPNPKVDYIDVKDTPWGAEPAPEAATASPVAAPKPATTPVSPAAADLMSLMNKYMSSESNYTPEIEKARKRAALENSAFSDMIAKAMSQEGERPSKAEMYFRLAAAFGSPTKTGAFGENLALAGKEMAEYAKEETAAKRANHQLRMQLGLEAQKIKAQAARDDLTALRSLAGEEMKDKRAVVLEYIKSGKPQSEAGKAAIDAGLTQGTKEFTDFVNNYIDEKIRSGNLFKEAMVDIAAGNLRVAQAGLDIKGSQEKRANDQASKLSPKEIDLKANAEATLGSLDDAMSSLKRAYSLNPKTFDGTLLNKAQQIALEQTNPKDPRVLATREQKNLLSKGGIDKLRAAFGGNPTEGERSAILDLEGLDSKSKTERATIMQNTYRLLKKKREREAKRLEDINQGKYRETTPAPEAQ